VLHDIYTPKAATSSSRPTSPLALMCPKISEPLLPEMRLTAIAVAEGCRKLTVSCDPTLKLTVDPVHRGVTAHVLVPLPISVRELGDFIANDPVREC